MLNFGQQDFYYIFVDTIQRPDFRLTGYKEFEFVLTNEENKNCLFNFTFIVKIFKLKHYFTLQFSIKSLKLYYF